MASPVVDRPPAAPRTGRRRVRTGIRVLGALVALAVVGLHLLALRTPPVPSAPAQAPRLVINQVTLVDPDSGGHLHPGQTVIIEHGRITFVGPAQSAPTGPGGQHIDGRGRYLIPGLWDAHVHTLRLAPQLQLPLLIAAGVTSVRDMGDTCSWSTSLDCASPAATWRRGIADGRMVGPRLHQVITYHLEEPPTDDAALRGLLASLRQRGDSIVKLQLDPQTPASRVLTVLRLADSLGLEVAGHVPFRLDLAATPVPFVSVEHDWTLLPQCSRTREAFDDRNASKPALLAGMDAARCDAVLHALRARGTVYVPTHVASTGQDALFARGAPPARGTARFVPAPQRWLWAVLRAAGAVDEPVAGHVQAYHRAALQLTDRAHRAGVTVLAGTDALDPEVVHGEALHTELEYLVRAGLTPAAALAAATTAPARAFGLSHTVGRIAAGQRADLVLLEANPLADIRNTARIHSVIADGRVFGRAERERLQRFVEQQAHALSTLCRFVRGLWYHG